MQEISFSEKLPKIIYFAEKSLFFRKTGFLNLLCNYNNFLWQILKIQVILVDLRCICYNTTPGAEVLKLPLNIGLQKWVIFTLLTILPLHNPNFLSCLQEFILTLFIPIQNHQLPTLIIHKIANFQFFTPENPQNEAYLQLQNEPPNHFHCLSGMVLGWYEVTGSSMTKICDITPVTLRGFLRYMVLKITAVFLEFPISQ